MTETIEAKKYRTFNVYLNQLTELGNNSGKKKLRFIVIEYVCRRNKIDPYKMAALLMTKGFYIVYDDSTISREANENKKKKVDVYYRAEFLRILEYGIDYFLCE